MPKGFFSQGLCVLLSEPVSLDRIAEVLGDFDVVRHADAGDDELIDRPSLVLDYRSEVLGRVIVSQVESLWPDEMGDPQDQADVFVAWSLGQFGPLTFPGCLERAVEQAWAWEGCAETVAKHQCFLRVLSSYVIGTDDDRAGMLPENYDPLDEMEFLTKIVSNLLKLPEALCYFNPCGEVLRSEDGLREGLNYAWCHHLPALDMWTNVRLFRATTEWSLMDTVGNGQFDLPDIEAAYVADRYESAEVEGFLRNASLYLLKEGNVINDDDTADGPGRTIWRAMICEDGLTDPPRPTVRWFPDDGSNPPEELIDTGLTDDEIEEQLDELIDLDDFDEDQPPF
ncbi:MAG: DUF4261 domain-containing protein [Pirellulaceae bacterium]